MSKPTELFDLAFTALGCLWLRVPSCTYEEFISIFYGATSMALSLSAYHKSNIESVQVLSTALKDDPIGLRYFYALLYEGQEVIEDNRYYVFNRLYSIYKNNLDLAKSLTDTNTVN